MVISFDDDVDFRDDDDDDVDDEDEADEVDDAAGDDRLVVVAVAMAEFGLAFPLALELFFGSGLRLGLFRVDISERGMVMYCWTPSSLCSCIWPVCSRLISTS